MRIGRTLSPAAAPISFRALFHGVQGLVCPDAARQRFTTELKIHFGRRHCFLLGSGRAALTVTLLALKRLHPERDQVLIPALTCYSVPAAIVRAGLQVTLCDVAPGSFDFDPEQLPLALANPRLLCIIPTHLFGCAADIPRLRQLLQGRSLPVIEDAAQAMGADDPAGRLGTFGDVALFSLGRGKALSTVEGGILLTDDDRLAGAIRREIALLPGYSLAGQLRLLLSALALKLLGAPWLYWLPQSLPWLHLGETVFDPDFRLRTFSGFQAGLSRSWQQRLDTFRRQRRHNACGWTELATIAALPPYPPAAADADLIRFPLLCIDEAQRQRLLQASARHGLGLAPVYPQAIGDIDALQGQCGGGPCPQARQLVRRLLTLPVHPLVSARDRRRIVRLLTERQSERKVSSLQQAGRIG